MAFPLALPCPSAGNPSQQLEVDPDKISINKSRNLAGGITQVKRDLLFTKYPIHDDESIDTWQKRIAAELKEQKPEVERKVLEDGSLESTEDYLKRMMSVEIEDLDLYYAVLALVAKEFGQENKINQDTFGEVNLDASIYFMRDIFKRARINLEEVFPKRFETT